METKKILILGDICPNQENEKLFIDGDAQKLFGKLLDRMKESNMVICNLEEPLTDATVPIKKAGAAFCSAKNSILAIKNAGITVASLANNHIRDFGDQGVLDTIHVCENAGIIATGAGANLSQARNMFLQNIGEIKIGLVSIADNEFSYATSTRAGAYGYDDLETMDWICSCKEKCDYLIVLYHSGLEHYEYPSPLLQRRCRKMIDKGANIVICQHSHCLGTTEAYKKGTIIYGQGNCLFAKKNKNEKWNVGCTIELDMSDITSPHIEYIPTRMQNGCVNIATEEDAKTIVSDFLRRSKNLDDDQFVQAHWEEWNKQRHCMYFGILLGFGRYLHRGNKLLNNLLGRSLITKRTARIISNIVRCESHRESLLAVLQQYEEQ